MTTTNAFGQLLFIKKKWLWENYKQKKNIFYQSFWEAKDVTKKHYQEAEVEIQQKQFRVPSSLIQSGIDLFVQKDHVIMLPTIPMHQLKTITQAGKAWFGIFHHFVQRNWASKLFKFQLSSYIWYSQSSIIMHVGIAGEGKLTILSQVP